MRAIIENKIDEMIEELCNIHLFRPEIGSLDALSHTAIRYTVPKFVTNLPERPEVQDALENLERHITMGLMATINTEHWKEFEQLQKNLETLQKALLEKEVEQ